MDINEDSLDLYTDLISEDYSNQPSKTDSTESQQQLLNTSKATIEKLTIELQEKAKKEAELQKRIEILEKNNSSLLLTAKSELGRKNSLISDLRDQIDEHTKSLFYNGKFNKYPDKKTNYSSRKRENSVNVSPYKNNRKRKNEETDDKKDSKRCRTTRRSGGIVTTYDSEIESKTDKVVGSPCPITKSCDVTSDRINPCETFDLRDKLRHRQHSGKESHNTQTIVSKFISKSNKIVHNGENNPKSCEVQCKGGISDIGRTSLPIPDQSVDSHGHTTLSEKEMELQKSTSLKQTSKCSILDVVDKLSNKANGNISTFFIPKLPQGRSSIEEDSTKDNKVLNTSLSAESSDETEKLIVDLNSASDLKSPPFNSQPNAKSISFKCNASQSETSANQFHDINGNTENVSNMIKRKQTTSESDSDFGSKLQFCVDMLSDSDPNETETWHTFQTPDVSPNRAQKVKDIQNVVENKKNSSSVKDTNERELMSPPKSLPKKAQKSANRNPGVSEKVASDSVSNNLKDSSLNLVQTQSVVNRILDLSKCVALKSQTQHVTHRSPVENNYEEPKHNTISYFAWKIPQQLTLSDHNLVQSRKYREQNIVLGIQDVPLSDPRTKTTGYKMYDMNNVPNIPIPSSDSVVNTIALVAESLHLMSKDLGEKDNEVASVEEKQRKEQKKNENKDCEKAKTDRKDNDGVKVRLALSHKRQEKDKTYMKTSRSEISSEDSNKQQKAIISKNEERELQGASADLKKTSKKTLTKQPSSSNSNKDETSVGKTKPLRRKSAQSKDEKEKKDKSNSFELSTPVSTAKPEQSSKTSTRFQSIEVIEIKSEPTSEPAPSTSSGLNVCSAMFMSNLAGSNNETELLKRLKKIEDEVQMLRSVTMQSLQTKVVPKTENVLTSQESESQQILGAGTNDNPIMISSSSEMAADISQAQIKESDVAFNEHGIYVGTTTDIRPEKSPSKLTFSENVSKDDDSSLCRLSTENLSNVAQCVSKTIPIQGVADSSSCLDASQTCNSEKVLPNSTEDSNSSINSSFSVHSANSSVSSSYNTNNVRNSFTKHETLVSCNNSDTDESLSESSEDENDLEKETNLNQNASEVLKTDLNMSSDSEDASKGRSKILPQTVETPIDVGKYMKTPIKHDIRSPWNRISPVPKFVSPENVNCDSKLLALVNLATLDLHLSGHDVPFENKAVSSTNENISNASSKVLSSTPCLRKTRSQGKSLKKFLPELRSDEDMYSNMVKFDNHQINSDLNNSHLTPVISPLIEQRHTSKTSSAESFVPMVSTDTPSSPKFEESMATDGLKTQSEESSAEIQFSQNVKASPNIEDFKIFQSVENETVKDTSEPISEKEDGEITQDSLIVNDNHKPLPVNTDSVHFIIDIKVDENDELFKCADAENSVSEKQAKKIVTPKKKQMCSVKTRSSPRIRSKSLRDRLGVRDETEKRASDACNIRRRSKRSPSPRSPRSNGRRRLYDNASIKSDHRSDSRPVRKPLTDSDRDRDEDNERLRHKEKSTRRSSRDRSHRERNRSRNCPSRS